MTTSFKDTEGREWLVRIDNNLIKRIRTNHGIDLATIIEKPNLVGQLANDNEKLVDVVHELCREQCETRNLTPYDFAAAIVGDVLGDIANTFMEAVIEYLPPWKSRLMRQAVDTLRAAEAQAELKIQTAINNGLLTKAFSEQMKKLDKILANPIQETAD